MKIHIVKRGETLARIAKKYNVSFEKLREINTHIKDAEKPIAGIKVKVPTVEIRLKPKQVASISDRVRERDSIQGTSSQELKLTDQVEPVGTTESPADQLSSEFESQREDMNTRHTPYASQPNMPAEMFEKNEYPNMYSPSQSYGHYPICRTCGGEVVPFPPYEHQPSTMGSYGYGPVDPTVHCPYDPNMYSQSQYPTPYQHQPYTNELPSYQPPYSPLSVPGFTNPYHTQGFNHGGWGVMRTPHTSHVYDDDSSSI